MESLIVTVMFGLGNRFLALASAFAIQETGVPVTIVWPPSRDCQIGFDQLFEPVENIKYSIPNPPPSYTCLNHAHYLRLQAQFQRTGIKNVHLQSYCPFFDSPTTAFRSLRPRQEYVDAVTALFGDRLVVGVQIRRTDHNLAIEHSPTELFLEAMAAYPTSFFFLATDSEFEKTKLRDIYGPRILTFDGPMTRWNIAGMKASFTDWLALSKCTEIIGSYTSSFSQTAADFGGVPLRVIKR